MATIIEDHVSFEIAKLLEEKGFNELCAWQYYTYWEGEKLKSYKNPILLSKMLNNSNVIDRDNVTAPTLQMATKWLREVHGLHISLEPCYDYDSMHVVFLAFVQNVADVHEFMDGRKNVASYPNAEKSYELAIKYCLENLI